MPYTTTEQMYKRAMREGFAVPGFAAYNLETIRVVIETAETMRSPVIIQTTPSNIDNIGIDYLVAIVETAAKKAGVPVALHLDHGDSIDRLKECIQWGFTSVMIDGSMLSYEENVQLTRTAVNLAHSNGVVVEAELGHVGKVEEDNSREGMYTDPLTAQRFAEQTGVDSLAVAIGTAHGVYKGRPNLDLERLSRIRSQVAVPLVLHGASGVPNELIAQCVNRGITKINIATELKIPYVTALRDYLNEHPAEFDPRKYCQPGRRAYAAVVKEKIELVGSMRKY